MSDKPFRTILADWLGEMHFSAREFFSDGTPKMGKFETEELYRQGVKFLQNKEIEPKAGDLTNAQRERVEMLAEEASEVVKCCTKILRHGYNSHNPDDIGAGDNRRMLEKELLDLWAVYERMAFYDDLSRLNFACIGDIWQKKLRYTYHQDMDGPANHPLRR